MLESKRKTRRYYCVLTTMELKKKYNNNKNNFSLQRDAKAKITLGSRVMKLSFVICIMLRWAESPEYWFYFSFNPAQNIKISVWKSMLFLIVEKSPQWIKTIIFFYTNICVQCLYNTIPSNQLKEVKILKKLYTFIFLINF